VPCRLRNWASLAVVAVAAPLSAAEPWLHGGYALQRFDVEHGLPVDTTTGVRFDAEGFLWVSTFDGLVRYDGTRFESFRSASEPGLPGNRLIDQVRDGDGALWWRSALGVTGRWHRGRFEALEEAAELVGRVDALEVDGEGRVWLAGARGVARHSSEGLVAVCATSADLELRAFWPLPPAGALLATSRQGALLCDGGGVRPVAGAPSLSTAVDAVHAQDGSLWTASAGEVYRLDGRRWTRLPLLAPGGGLPSGGGAPTVIASFFTDDQGTLWAATNHGLGLVGDAGVELFAPPRPANARIRRPVQHDGEGTRWLAHGTELYRGSELVVRLTRPISGFELGPEASVWIATEAEGLLRLRRRIGEVFLRASELREANLYAVAASPSDPEGIWVGGLRGGLFRLRVAVGIAEPVHLLEPIWSILEDSRGRLWLGGTELCPLIDGRCDASLLAPGMEAFAGRDLNVRLLLEDREGSVWIGSAAGLHRLAGDGRFETVAEAGAPVVRVGVERADGSLWFDTNGGGLLVWRDGRLAPPQGAERLPSPLVRSLHEDAAGTLWVGTEDRGLLRLETADDAIIDLRVLGPVDGLWDDVIHAIVEDAGGRLWMNSNRGIFWVERRAVDAYPPRIGDPLPVVGYTEEDGLLHREGNGGSQSSSLLDQRGHIWFPGQGGLVRIDPATLSTDLRGPQVVIERAVTPGGVLQRPQALMLPARRRELAVHLAAPTYRHPERARFRYRLLGFDAAWIEAGNRRDAFYTNLPPGQYRFEALAADAYGRWGPAAGLEVTAPPRTWERPWFQAAALALLVGVGLAGYRRSVHALAARAARLQELVDERTRELRHEKETTEAALATVAEQARRLAELDAAKSRFFTNLSHELRTPLTLILGPAEQALAEAPPAPVRERLTSIRRNAERLLELVGQLLALSRLEAGAYPLELRRSDLAALCRELLARFTSLAEQRGVSLVGPGPEQRCAANLDADTLDKIVSNLVANALAHAPAGTTVSVDLRRVAGGVVLTVTDQGAGIPPELQGKVFERFYTGRHEGGGAGIGLALARELAHLHGGDLSLRSVIAQGSTFELVLPLVVEEWEEDPTTALGPPSFEQPSRPVAVAPRTGEGADEDHTTVLVVEDDTELRSFVADCLASRFRVLEAADGEDGLARARAELPDVVVSDLMMPRLDGLGLVRGLAADPASQAIPVILLTARAGQENELAGLAAGAVDYLVKPFAPEILLARVERLLSFARRLREQLRQQRAVEAEAAGEVRSPAPLARIEAVLQRDLGDPELDVENLARAAYVSRSQLKRLLEAAGQPPPSVLIRERRLEEAARLLAAGRGTVTEVAYATGFASLSHFARRFRERFGQAPSDYVEAHRKRAGAGSPAGNGRREGSAGPA
jgi:signal transduction histidine kinase/ligand-binding sensor domain-containing protein/CheY-like chemotaxis protein